MTKIIGLTGGIGSGKTTIADYFRSKGIPVYIADDEARKLMQSQVIIEAIKNSFGETIFEEGILNRERLAGIVFNDADELNRLNAIIHPAVKAHFNEWLTHHKEFPIIIYEAAVLFENGSYKNFDAIISVVAPLKTRIQRVIQRDNTTEEHVLKRIAAQWTDEQRIAKSDFVIENTDLEQTKIKTDEILKILQIKQKDS
ncbi:dephospho-CoA kinase [Flavobacterium sp. UMI-01]|uniref:dephospho-CoA kinase n=1 Tax=Flavobacterium sp. UMI-01 TaxID=1441053 RepID=UPI001C7D6878|nr:dephospho-CoA kinase [Flavobacterium sp. UMI-01]GIZ07668.1 dephospho-CoA kinase [Flavobacterium sp. UMI-01]